ncbi:amine oxidase [Violaceomyces palustris]|uniref:Amine oxidase n=1 Tax=Violaceomyces palustris TaxID=1673888 RepID=A0ACD0NNA3_9BASI|nr:amine oxidase [Violaceomyces palustris]
MPSYLPLPPSPLSTSPYPSFLYPSPPPSGKPCCSQGGGRRHKTKVAILGGGVSGIASAKVLLQEYGISDFVILEARHELGGRAQDTKIGQTTIERGCNWIQGLGENPIWKLAQKWGLENVEQDYSDLVTYDTSGLVNDTVVMQRYDKLFESLGEYAANRSEQGRVDLTVKAASGILGWVPTTPVEKIYEYYNIDFETAEPPQVCSFYNALGNTEGGFAPGNNLVLDPRGFKYIFQQEAYSFLDQGGKRDPRVHYDTLVTEVRYGQEGVEVVTDKGTIFEADYAISTFSVGVLQNHDVRFLPELPEWKREAIYAFDMATYTKIFLHFPSQFWGDEQYMLWADPDVRGRYGIWQNLNAPGFLPRNGSENIFFVTVTDSEAYRVESMSDQEVQDELMQLLRSIYGNDIPDPDDFYMPRWTKDPLFRGSYSNWPVGELEGHHQNLRAPLLDRLHFTGEAMSAPYFGFLQGAWLEGESTARAVGQCLVKGDASCPSYEYHVELDVCEQPTSFTKRTGGYGRWPKARDQTPDDGYERSG